MLDSISFAEAPQIKNTNKTSRSENKITEKTPLFHNFSLAKSPSQSHTFQINSFPQINNLSSIQDEFSEPIDEILFLIDKYNQNLEEFLEKEGLNKDLNMLENFLENHKKILTTTTNEQKTISKIKNLIELIDSVDNIPAKFKNIYIKLIQEGASFLDIKVEFMKINDFIMVSKTADGQEIKLERKGVKKLNHEIIPQLLKKYQSEKAKKVLVDFQTKELTVFLNEPLYLKVKLALNIFLFSSSLGVASIIGPNVLKALTAAVPIFVAFPIFLTPILILGIASIYFSLQALKRLDHLKTQKQMLLS